MNTATCRIAHTVLFAFKDGCKEEVEKVFVALGNLKTQNLIPGILSFNHGPNVSIENLSKGFNYGFTMVFESEAARDAYIPHPEHVRIVDMIMPLLVDGLNSALVMDWQLNGVNEI